MPKYQIFPFFVDDISGSRAPALFLVEDGASMILRRLTRTHGVRLAHIDQRARAPRDAPVGQMRVHLGEDRRGQTVPLQQVRKFRIVPQGLYQPAYDLRNV